MAETKNKTRVLILTRTSTPYGGGMERLQNDLMQELLARSDIRIQTKGAPLSKTTSLTATRAASLISLIRMLPSIRTAAQEVDVVHLSDPVLSIIGWYIKKKYRKPVTVTVHGLDITYHSILYQLYLTVFFRHLNAYFPISAYVDNLLAKRTIHNDRTVINPGVRDSFYAPTCTKADLTALLKSKGYELQKNKVTLLTTGRLIYRKGHGWFIKNVLPNLPSSCIYIIAGDGPERKRIQDTTTSCGMKRQVIVLGRVSEEELKILYNTVDTFIQPNIHSDSDIEGFGLVVLEAAACARPVFASKIDGIPDAVHHGRNGTLIEAGNAVAWTERLQTFLDNPGNHNPQGQDARTYTLSHFSVKRAAEQYTAAFKKVDAPM